MADQLDHLEGGSGLIRVHHRYPVHGELLLNPARALLSPRLN